MRGKERELIRLAGWIHDKLSNNHYHVAPPALPIERWSQLALAHRRLAIAMERKWTSAIASARSELHDAVRMMRYGLSELDERLADHVDPIASLTHREILDELNALREEFDSVEFDYQTKRIRVTTDPIELEGLYLGPFTVELDVTRHHNGVLGRYRIIARDPQPSRRNPEVPHPHVASEQMCEGDGQSAIGRALTSGRLHDFFTVVVCVLRTYNSGSPHVSLEKWDGVSCQGCGDSVSDDDRYGCYRCGADSCLECSTSCPICENEHCQNCMARCSGCADWVCNDCFENCNTCSTELCSICLGDHQICKECHERELEESEELEECVAEPCSGFASAETQDASI